MVQSGYLSSLTVVIAFIADSCLLLSSLTVVIAFIVDSCYCFAIPIDISAEKVFMLCSALWFVRSALRNVYSAVVNVCSTLRNIAI